MRAASTRSLLGASTTNTGSITASGELLTTPSDETFTSSARLSVRVRDALSLDQDAAWTATQCVTSKAGAVKCKSPDKTLAGTFRPLSMSFGLYRFTLTLRRLAIHGPFQPVVTVDVDQGAGRIFEGTIATCMSGNGTLTCRAR